LPSGVSKLDKQAHRNFATKSNLNKSENMNNMISSISLINLSGYTVSGKIGD
jgi:hypothetical protein